MADPFEALKELAEPVEPDPLFAAHLRARIVRALALPGGVTVSNLILDTPASATQPAGADSTSAGRAVVPYLIVSDARRALAWYADAMGAVLYGEAIVMDDGRIGHSEFRIGGGIVYLADESPGSDVAAPRPGEGATVSLTLDVPDVDRVAEQAVRAGAAMQRPPADYPYGRNAVIRDPFGHRWIVSSESPRSAPAPEVALGSAVALGEPASVGAPSGGTAGARPGDIAYVSLWVPDVEGAADFYGEVLGWTYASGRGGQVRQVVGQSLPHGLFGSRDRPTLFLCFAVADVASAVERVRAAGGQAGPPSEEPYGRVADCSDDQGVRFAVIEAPGGVTGPRRPITGDVAYVTMEVQDSARARAFYGSVLGWRFTPGRVEDGWGTVDVVPMTGLSGGHEHATTVPMYRVDDIVAAVTRVRARGGTSTDPVAQPYGLTAECADDQGTRFYLGQL